MFLKPLSNSILAMASHRLLKSLLNRYSYIVYLEAVMVYIHTQIISIYPLLFIVWPLCLWLFIEILGQFKGERLNMLAFLATFLIYLFITQMLVVERWGGIFFDLERVPNMPLLSYFVLGEAAILFLYKLLSAPSVKLNDIISFIGFASIIPWLAPLIVESVVLARWSLEGGFYRMTEGKCIGGGGFNDILFHYGGRNFIISLTLFSTLVLLVQGVQRANLLMEERRHRKALQEESRRWRIRVWEDPTTLLNDDERAAFQTAYRHLSREQQNEILRSKVLPGKGIILEDPGEVE